MSIFNRTPKATTQAAGVAVLTPAKSVPVSAFDAGTAAVADVTGDYTVDATHTRIGFSARHAMVTTVRGAFTEFTGTAHLDQANPTASSVNLQIKAASIDTGNSDRDGHVRSGDFLDVEKFPELTFASTETEKVDDETYKVTGNLTIKDVTRPVTIDFTLTGSAIDPYSNLRVGFDGILAIKRSNWGLTYNAALETGGVLISDTVKIELDVSAIRNA